MANSIVRLPYQYFGDPNKGRPIFSAQIYIGEPDLNPGDIPLNQKTVTARQEDGTEVTIVQPITTGSGGYPEDDSGNIIELLVDGAYSILVNDRFGDQEYYSSNVEAGAPVTFDDNPVFCRDTLATAIADLSLLVGYCVETTGYTTANDGGGANYIVVAGGTGTDDGGSYIDMDNGNQLQLLLNREIISAGVFGVTMDNVTDDTDAWKSLANFVNTFNAGGFDFTESSQAERLSVKMGYGTTLVSEELNFNFRLFGHSPTASMFRRNPSSFTGEHVLRFGDNVTDTPVFSAGMERVGINVSASDTIGFGVYGLRDTSAFRDIYIVAFKDAAALKTRRAGPDPLSGLVNEGIIFENIHAVSQVSGAINTNVFDISGINETTFTNCKSLASSTNPVIGTPFLIGDEGKVRDISFYECSVGFADAPVGGAVFWVVEGDNVNNYAFQIEGWNLVGIKYGDSSTGRIANRGTFQGPTFQDNAAFGAATFFVEFDQCSSIVGDMPLFGSASPIANFTADSDNCTLQITSTVDIASTIYTLDGNENVIWGNAEGKFTIVSSDTVNAIQLNTLNILESDGFWPTIKCNDSERIRFRKTDDTNILEYEDTQGIDGQWLVSKGDFQVGSAWDSGNLLKMGTYQFWVDASGLLRIKDGQPTSDLDGTIVGTQS